MSTSSLMAAWDHGEQHGSQLSAASTAPQSLEQPQPAQRALLNFTNHISYARAPGTAKLTGQSPFRAQQRRSHQPQLLSMTSIARTQAVNY